MIARELVKRSPIRILEQSLHGGAGKGNVGVFAGNKGVGKTACLVHLATDRLIQGRHVIHVSFSRDTTHIVAWYEDIFTEIARRYALDGAMEVHNSIISNRIITTFKQSTVHWDRVEKTLQALIKDGGFTGDTVVVDGYTFPESDLDEFKGFRRFAKQAGLEVWFSASVARAAGEGDGATRDIPLKLRPFDGELSVILMLVDRETHISLELIKDHENPVQDCHLKLDPRILLIAEET